MSTVVVSSVSGLHKALKSAEAGETIELAPGTYSDVKIRSFSKASGVTITSENASHQAVLTGLTVTGSNGLTFQGLTFSFAAAKNAKVAANATGVSVSASKNITFTGDSVHGVLNGNPTLDIHGMTISGSSNVTITNSDFQQLDKAILEENNNGVLISGDSFQHLRSDGVDNVGTSNLTIADNNFTSFNPYRVGQPGGDHPDAIQFWTTGADGPSSNITVTNNVIVQGHGGAFQGIFVKDELGHVPLSNVMISDNLIVGGMANSIYANDAHGLTVSSNTIVPTSSSANKLLVRLVADAGVQILRNAAPRYMIKGNTHMSVSANKSSALAKDGGVHAINAWLAQHPEHSVHVGPTTASGLVNDALSAVSAPSHSATILAADALSHTVDGSELMLLGSANEPLGAGLYHLS